MGSVTDKGTCPVCGESYWYDFNYRTGETTKLSPCECDRKIGYCLEFIKAKGLEKEFQEFARKREKDYWYDWIVDNAKSSDVELFLEELRGFYHDKMAPLINTDETLEAVAEGLREADYTLQEIEELIEGLSSLLNTNKIELRKKLLAMIV